MTLEQELLALEERFWVADGRTKLLRERLAGDAVFVYPEGVLDDAEIIDSLEEESPWTAVRIEGCDLVHLRDSAAVLTYRAEASGDGRSSSVYAASVWIEDDDGVWRLAFHQETPIPA